MNPAPLLLHVGLHKTGTTWLQKRVFEAKAGKEIEYCGSRDVIYSQLITPGSARFSPEAARGAFGPLLDAAAERRRLAVISGENLGGRPFHAKYQREVVASRLAATFPGAKILLTIREQRAIIYSMYGQYLRFGFSSALEAFLTEPPPDAPYNAVLDRSFYDYEEMINTYTRFFPEADILVIPFEWMIAEPDAAVSSIAAHTGTILSGVGAEQARKVENPGWSDLAYEALRFFNHFHSQDSQWQRRPRFLPPNSVAYWVDRLTPGTLRRSMRAARMALIDQALGDTYAASNRRVAARIAKDLAAYGYRC